MLRVKPLDQHLGREDHGVRVSDRLPGYLGGRTVGCLCHRAVVTRAEAGGESQTPHKTGRQVRKNVAEHVRAQDDVEFLRAHYEVQRRGVDLMIVQLDVGVVLGDSLDGFHEQPVGQLEHASFVDGGDEHLVVALARGVEGGAARFARTGVS